MRLDRIWFCCCCVLALSSAERQRGCSRGSGLTTKYQDFSDATYGTISVELVDNCYAVKSRFKLRSRFSRMDRSTSINGQVVSSLKQALGSMGFQVQKVLGQGNYGRVFAAKSSVYGNVAIKVATTQDGSFYDMHSKSECSFLRQTCRKPLSQLLPFEVACGVVAMHSPGIIKSKAFGIISSRDHILFYVIVMENIENSMTLLAFTKKCMNRFKKSAKLFYIKQVQKKLSEVNIHLAKKFGLFHNDLKSDNILVRVSAPKSSSSSSSSGAKNQCGKGSSPLELYLIDFGNAILDIRQSDSTGNKVMSAQQYQLKPYFIVYKAPELHLQLPHIQLSKLISWYMGVIAFEMCSGGLERVMLAPNANTVSQLVQGQASSSSANAYDLAIKPQARSQPAVRFCMSQPQLAAYLKAALKYDAKTRLPSYELVKQPFMASKRRSGKEAYSEPVASDDSVSNLSLPPTSTEER